MSNIVVDQTVLYLQMKSKQVKVQIKKLLFGGKQPEEKPVTVCQTLLNTGQTPRSWGLWGAGELPMIGMQ